MQKECKYNGIRPVPSLESASGFVFPEGYKINPKWCNEVISARNYFCKNLNMKTHKFKTNINCGGCVAAVKPFLDKNEKITNWNVDTSVPSRELTVESEDLSDQTIAEIISKAGFQAEPIS